MERDWLAYIKLALENPIPTGCGATALMLIALGVYGKIRNLPAFDLELTSVSQPRVDISETERCAIKELRADQTTREAERSAELERRRQKANSPDAWWKAYNNPRGAFSMVNEGKITHTAASGAVLANFIDRRPS